jgi:hypothetical protein
LSKEPLSLSKEARSLNKEALSLNKEALCILMDFFRESVIRMKLLLMADYRANLEVCTEKSRLYEFVKDDDDEIKPTFV